MDSNASASVSQFLRSSIQLIKVSNQMETPNSEVHVWTLALHLGVLSGELHEQHIRFTQKFVALLKMRAPTKGAAETREAHELNLKNYAKEVASLEGLLARIKGCSHVIKDLAAWAELFKYRTAEEQKDASVLLSVEFDTMKSFYREKLERGDKLAHPVRSWPKSDGAFKDLTDHLKKIFDYRKLAGAKALREARDPPPSWAASGKAVVLGKRGGGGDYSDREKAPRVPGTSRMHFADKPQVEELQTVTSTFSPTYPPFSSSLFISCPCSTSKQEARPTRWQWLTRSGNFHGRIIFCGNPKNILLGENRYTNERK